LVDSSYWPVRRNTILVYGGGFFHHLLSNQGECSTVAISIAVAVTIAIAAIAAAAASAVSSAAYSSI
jgi:hypothetical protein